MHGWPVARRNVRGRDVWLDREGRCHAAPGPERWLYRVDGDRLAFVGHGARRCAGCGATVEPDPDNPGRPIDPCPLCGRAA